MYNMFWKNKSTKDGLCSYCIQCDTEKKKKHRVGKSFYIATYAKKPWLAHYKRARNRKLFGYKTYIHRDFSITKDDVREIWFRDEAYNMQKPSIDRIMNNVGYVKNNIRFIELIENLRRKK